MKRKPVTLLLCCLCLVLLTGAWLVLRHNNETARQEAANDDDPEPILTIDPDDVKTISFQIGGSSSTFSKNEETWTLAEDEDFPVKPDQLFDTLAYLEPLGAVRTLTDISDLSEYGLDTPQNTLTVTTQNGNETKITIGDTNASTGDDYVMLNDEKSTIYTISSDLRSSLSDDLYDYARSEELPALQASEITKVEVSLDKKNLTLSLEDNLWTVLDENGPLENTDQEAVSQSISVLAGPSYVDFLDYNCASPEQYGLNPPAATITITYTDENSLDSDSLLLSGETETDDLTLSDEDETDDPTLSGEDETDDLTLSDEDETDDPTLSDEEAETTSADAGQKQLILHVGTVDSNGNYYVQQEGSTEVHTMTAACIETVLGWSAADFEAEAETGTEADTEAEFGTETETDF